MEKDGKNGELLEKKWQEDINKKSFKEKGDLEKNHINSKLEELENLIEKEKTKYFVSKPSLATRQCSMATIESITSLLPQLIGGSADLSGSNNTKTNNSKIINSKILKRNYIHLWSERAWHVCDNEWFSSLWRIDTLWRTFLIFSDYSKPSIDYLL